MRAVLAALTLITSGAEARGTEIYRNYTDMRHRCFEYSRPAQRRLKKQKADSIRLNASLFAHVSKSSGLTRFW